ncbi:MAG: CpsD/CapB family tyrosine-protein kinase, partial [Deltaproteobacteria bacterium]|nr:CpsD/CapB family tyrosine-protein kinase [Deltaproteobacteria bacterium]
LFGELEAEQIIQTLGIDNFYFITSGRTPPNPAELLSLTSMDELLQELRAHFDFVIIDAPPVLPVSDPSILAPKVDGVIMVYQVGKTARGALRRAKIQLTSAGAKILGVVLNNIKAAEMKMSPSYYYYYKEYYGSDENLVRERHKHKKEKHWWQKMFSKAA